MLSVPILFLFDDEEEVGVLPPPELARFSTVFDLGTE
jgi:hypothetical protein